MPKPEDLCFVCEVNDFQRWLHCKVPCTGLLVSKGIQIPVKESFDKVVKESVDSIKALNEQRERIRDD